MTGRALPTLCMSGPSLTSFCLAGYQDAYDRYGEQIEALQKTVEGGPLQTLGKRLEATRGRFFRQKYDLPYFPIDAAHKPHKQPYVEDKEMPSVSQQLPSCFASGTSQKHTFTTRDGWLAGWLAIKVRSHCFVCGGDGWLSSIDL